MKLLKLLPIIGIALFVYIIWTNSPLRIAEAFFKINYFYLSFAIILNIFIVILKGIKWKAVINIHGFDYSLKDSIKVWCTGLFAGSVTPGRVGDLIRVLYLKEKERNFGRRLSTVVVDRLFDLFSVLIFAAFGMVLINCWFGSYFASFGFLVLFVGFFFAVVYFIINKKITRFFARPIFNFFVPGKYKSKFKIGFDDFYKSISSLKNKKQKLFAILIFTMVLWVISVFDVYLISMSIGINAGYWYLLAVISMVAIIELIPVSVMGLGTRDAFLIFSLSLIGVSSQIAIVFSLLYLIVGYWIIGFLGFVFWLRKPVKLKI
jgi:uncharacterized protein (TIRG00374 family)